MKGSMAFPGRRLLIVEKWVCASVALFIYMVTLSRSEAASSFLCNAIDAFVVGDELRLLVETSQDYTPVYMHSSRTVNIHYYYVTMHLDSVRSMTSAAILTGPIWSADAKSAGEKFLPLSARRTMIYFDDEGELVKLFYESGTWRREMLDVGGFGSRWQFAGVVESIPSIPPELSQKNRVNTVSRHFVAQRESDASVRIYNSFTGKRQPDEWLETTLALVWKLGLIDARIAIADDLSAVVCWPDSGIYKAQDGQVIATFEVNGTPFERSRFYIAANRGHDGLRALAKGIGELPPKERDRSFRGVLSIDGKPAVLLAINGGTQIIGFDQKVLYKCDAEVTHLRQHDTDTHTLVFNRNVVTPPMWSNTHVIVWKYITGEKYLYGSDLSPLFNVASGDVVPVKEALPLIK